MNINEIFMKVRAATGECFDIYERKPGQFQVILPILHEDGDMVDIYLIQSPGVAGQIRICDFGMAAMRLSYTFDVGSTTRKKVFDSILVNNGVRNDDGNLYMDSSVQDLYPNILQFAGCVQKICNMKFFGKGSVRSAFYDDLEICISEKMSSFKPSADHTPLPKDYSVITVDWLLQHNDRSIYLFGVKGRDKAKSAAIFLLELKKVELAFISVIVHDDMEQLGPRERTYLTRNADKQYPCLKDFAEQGVRDMERLAA